MNEPVQLVQIRACDDGTLEVLCPKVGWWYDHPHPGALLGPGSHVGLLEHQNRRIRLILPDGSGGRLKNELPADRKVAVDYGQVLLNLSPVEAGDREGLLPESSGLGRPSGASLPEGTFAVVAPTDGVFYSKPSPEAAPFVEVGQKVNTGQPVGLVEVMKTFNQIQYGGPGLPDEAEVAEIRVDDAEEISAGQVLVVFK